ncbi:MAG: hypothetical protein MI746_18235 [Pseudomonadales bacterium]|nr:hypothetical protein [Pseudomonadales bacterium]
MNPLLRTVLAVIAGFVCGSVVNMVIVTVGPILVPPPPGVDMSTMESLAETIHLMGPINFAVPFFAHALGTLVGVLLACLIISNNRSRMAYGMGALFLAGGIAASVMIPAPAWFIAVDLLLAYLPMAWIGLTLAERIKPLAAAESATSAE